MPSGAGISADAWAIILHMHETLRLNVREIIHLTNVPQHSVYQILSTWKQSGKIKPKPSRKRGCPRALDFADTQVCLLPCHIAFSLLIALQAPYDKSYLKQ